MSALPSLLVACTGDPTPTPAPPTDTAAVVDTADPDDTDPRLPPAALTLCGPAAFPDVATRVHTCPEPCDDGLQACSWDSTTETGWPSRSVRFVAAGRGGTLRYATQTGPTLLVHNGGTGTTFAHCADLSRAATCVRALSRMGLADQAELHCGL